MAKNERKDQLLQLIWENPGIKISGIQILMPGISLSTISRDVKALVTEEKLVISGTGRNTAYSLARGHRIYNR